MSANQLIAAAEAVVRGGIGFVPVSPSIQDDAMTALSLLAELSEQRKNDHDFPHHVWGYNPDDKGQFDRGLSQPRTDERKTIFHYTPSVPEELKKLGCPTEDWRDFFKLLDDVYDVCRVTSRAFADALDKRMPGLGFAESCEEAGEASSLRLLVYDRRRHDTKQTAFPHLDRSGVSFCVAESAPGFFVGETRDGRLPVMTPLRTMPVFAGRKLMQMTGGRIRPLWHGTEEVPDLEPEGRRAAVFFLHPNVPLVREPHELVQAELPL